MFSKYSMHLAIIALVAITLTACSSGTGQTTDPQPVPTIAPTSLPATPITQEPTPMPPTGKIGRANVDSIEIVMRESMPVQISANIKGTVSDSCTVAGPITQEREGNTFRITIGATRPQDAICSQVITPYEQSIALDAKGLKAGTYKVEANGVSQTFDLATDNIIP